MKDAARLADAEIDRLPVAAGAGAQVPTVSLDRADAAAAVARAAQGWGMFLVGGHGIDPAFLDRCMDRMRGFFARPKAYKRALSRSFDNPWGFYDRELTKNVRDRKEVFDIGPVAADEDDPFSGTTPWPAGDPGFVADMIALAAAAEALSARLVEMIVAELGAPAQAVAGAFHPAPTSFLRLNHYPVEDPLADLGEDGAGRAVHHHSDAGALTVLLEDGNPGLQVLRDGIWHDVRPQPGTLVVNVGDMLQVWSNDRIRAPLHRVLAMTRAPRFSAPFFFNPSYSAQISPLPGTGVPRYRPVPWAEFRRLRAEGDYGDQGREVQIADYAVCRPAD